MAQARRDVLGLTGRTRADAGLPHLYAISPHVLRVPGEHNHTTGYWFSDHSSWRPTPELEAFVSDGPIVSIGFGSMATRDPEKVTAAVREAVRRVGTKAILLVGSGGLSGTDFGSEVMVVDSVPHEWLFPRMSAIVHHGGAGTTAAALRAGRASVVVPFTVDQPFWGQRVAHLGVAPRPIPRRKLTGESLAAALDAALTDTTMSRRAAALGHAIREEKGITRAVELLETHAA